LEYLLFNLLKAKFSRNHKNLIAVQICKDFGFFLQKTGTKFWKSRLLKIRTLMKNYNFDSKARNISKCVYFIYISFVRLGLGAYYLFRPCKGIKTFFISSQSSFTNRSRPLLPFPARGTTFNGHAFYQILQNRLHMGHLPVFNHDMIVMG